MAIIYAFDLGTTSIGWTVLQGETEEADQPSSIIPDAIKDSGVRIFPETRDQKTKTLFNQERRSARSVRRQTRRRRMRKKNLRDFLNAQNLLPAYSPERGSEWEQIMSRNNSWALREKALNAALSPYELGQVLYHLVTRRQFRGRDDQLISMTDEKVEEQQRKEEKKEGRTKTVGQRKELIKVLNQTGETLGSHLAKLDILASKRNQYATRAVIEDEFDQIIKSQMAYHPNLKEIQTDLKDCIFAQKPVFWRGKTLGKCNWCPDSKLAPKGSWIACQKRMLEKINNLKIDKGNWRTLDDQEKTLIIKKAQTQKEIRFTALYKLLGLEEGVKFNLDVHGEKLILGNPVEADLYKIFGDQWEDHPQKQALRDQLHHYLFKMNYHEIGEDKETNNAQRIVIRRAQERIEMRDKIVAEIVETHGLSFEEAEQIMQIKLPAGWEPFSEQALQIFLPELECGHLFGNLLSSPNHARWREAMFPNRIKPTGDMHDYLQSPNKEPAGKAETKYLQNLRNPTLQRCLNELRKVTNNLIREYGKPDLIRLEVTRDLALSNKAKAELEKAQNKQRKKRDYAEKELKEKGIPVTHDTIEKHLLAEECGWECPYSGDKISWNALFIDNQFQVEHIYPRSRTLDDSFKNKTLCRSDLNREKGNRTPYEAFNGQEIYERMINRVKDMVSKKDGMHKEKLKRFQAQTLPDDFTNRHLTDTGYITRQARDYLKRLWPDHGVHSLVRVQTYSGKITGELRRLWGLNEILSGTETKTRDDHRHHALDAIVIGCMTPGLQNQLSRYYGKMDDTNAKRPKFDPPWTEFRQSVEASLNKIIVSHKVRKKLSGALHEGTYFGKTQEQEGDSIYYVVREAIEKLYDNKKKKNRDKKIELIRDERIKEIIKTFIAENGGSLKEALKTGYPRLPSRKGPHEPEIRKVRILEKAQPKIMTEAASSWVKTGNTHHIAIYRLPNNKAAFETVTLLEARKRLARKAPIVNKTHPEQGGELVMSLSKGDLVFFPKGINGQRYWKYLTSNSNNGQISFTEHYDAKKNDPKNNIKSKKPMTKYANGLIKENAQKISIDPIGRIKKAK